MSIYFGVALLSLLSQGGSFLWWVFFCSGGLRRNREQALLFEGFRRWTFGGFSNFLWLLFVKDFLFPFPEQTLLSAVIFGDRRF